MNLTDSQLSQRGSEKLELAILSFFEQFRKMYVGDQAQKTSKVNFFIPVYYYKIIKVTCARWLVESPKSMENTKTSEHLF